MGEETTVSKNFIEQEIDKDLAEGVYRALSCGIYGKGSGQTDGTIGRL